MRNTGGGGGGHPEREQGGRTGRQNRRGREGAWDRLSCSRDFRAGSPAAGGLAASPRSAPPPSPDFLPLPPPLSSPPPTLQGPHRAPAETSSSLCPLEGITVLEGGSGYMRSAPPPTRNPMHTCQENPFLFSGDPLIPILGVLSGDAGEGVRSAAERPRGGQMQGDTDRQTQDKASY